MSRPGSPFKVLQNLTAMVRSGDMRIMELSTVAATQRVYAELLRMARPDAAVPDLWVIHPLPPLREIASRVSTTRETVARAQPALPDRPGPAQRQEPLHHGSGALQENLDRPAGRRGRRPPPRMRAAPKDRPVLEAHLRNARIGLEKPAKGQNNPFILLIKIPKVPRHPLRIAEFRAFLHRKSAPNSR